MGWRLWGPFEPSWTATLATMKATCKTRSNVQDYSQTMVFPENTFQQRSITHSHRVTQQFQFNAPFAHTNSYLHSFVPHTPSTWNSLPDNFVSAPSYNAFMGHLRSWSSYTFLSAHSIFLLFWVHLILVFIPVVYPLQSCIKYYRQKRGGVPPSPPPPPNAPL